MAGYIKRALSFFFANLYHWVLKLGKLDHFIVEEGLQKELLNMAIQEIFRALIFTRCKAIHDIIHVSLWRINILAHLSKFIYQSFNSRGATARALETCTI